MKSFKKFLLEASHRKKVIVPRYVYHVTTKPNTFNKMKQGIKPISSGSPAVGEGSSDKTYAYLDLKDAVSFYESILSEYQDKVEFKHEDAEDYPFVIFSIDTSTTKSDWYHDEESEGLDNLWVFTDKEISGSCLEIIKMDKIIHLLKTKIWPSQGWTKQDIDKVLG